ncbi:LysM peptidoglycan-binding domain-containing protein [Paenibacillus sp. FA6]|uniref:LysM peptidoglycan-binding domain-containing protein n=1 Tax=Paenibacillus sp. FA6 TaxID=3413029 RepID=UPI003F65B577
MLKRRTLPVFDQSYGLRFDIYERIQLSEEVAGIAELEEVELLPHIQVINQDEEATLRGHLLLTGLYRGEGEEEGTQRLEHYIPVEITVPLNRVSSLNEIAVEIENFDIDLLSKRSLNITGVLSLRGIESPGEDISAWNAEEFTVVHAPDWEAFQNSSSRPPGEDIVYEDQVGNEWLELSEPIDGQDAQANISALHMDEEGLARLKDHSNVWQIKTEDDQELSSPTLNSLQDEQLLNEANAEREPSLNSSESGLLDEDSFLAAGISESAQVEEIDEKVELKIALGSKKEPTTSRQDQVGLSSILNSSRARSLRDLEQQVQEEQLQAREVNNDHAVNEEVEWKSLFLGGTSEKTPFSKVRLCIVQREETIDLIADRYQMSSRELLLYNRLSEQTIEEGQILYIP